MRKILTAALLAGVATSAFAASALAADLPTRKGPPPAPIYAPPPFTWTGFYVGINGGVGLVNLRSDTFGPLAGVGPTTAFGDPTGGMIGGTIGYNYQMGQMVLGVEATLDWADLSRDRTFINGSTDSFRIDSVGTVLGRLGYAWDRTLFYIAGGYAGADVNVGNLNDTALGLSFPGTSGWQNGWAFGGGIEYAFTNNISIKGEYLFSELEGKTYFGGTPDAVKTGVDLSTIKFGINYKF